MKDIIRCALALAIVLIGWIFGNSTVQVCCAVIGVAIAAYKPKKK